ncbi:diguanylate phosphodiesterase [Aeromonas veronii]|uniref:EAL domain-containing protein n=1 Tax=Aeromonas veronii TaxID=654 RepID=UPI000C28B8CA|nr:EAL domain-containing protein [Aeromonas veronii]ATY80457.1 diguanylate phosphodiesterase [Aeromonas veronii]HEA3202750.1 EAL domain-containing protein [Aeromonas veronii]
MLHEKYLTDVKLRDGLANPIPFYQPIINKDNQVIGCEVLARCRENRHAPPLVIDFFTLSQEDVLVIDIAMLNAVLIDLPTLKKAGVNVLSINLNPELECPIYKRLLLQVVLESKRLGIESWLEVLECADLGKHQKNMLEMMRGHGAKIVCDDFGTLACNFQRVLEFPYEIIKLDRSLLLQASEHTHALRMLSGLIEYLHVFNMQVVCEGVETNAHIEIANQLGCDYQQGYTYGKPAPLSCMLKA